MNRPQPQLYPTQAKRRLEWATRLWRLGEIQTTSSVHSTLKLPQENQLLGMLSTARAEMPWMPTTEAEQAAVLREMHRLLNSRHFRNSKRYPALFEHIIRETLAGNADSLKERVLGMAVFHRPPDYDANADPIVRVTAGEVRKRIAQFYHEEAPAEEVYIDLRPGSYVPEFYPVVNGVAETKEPFSVPLSVEMSAPITGATRRSLTRRASALALVTIALLAVLLLAAFTPWRSMDQRTQMWYPLLNSPAPVLVVVGQPHLAQADNSSAHSVYEHSPASELELADAIAMAHLSNILDAHHHLYQITGVGSTSLSDLRKGPAILVGGFNNPWSLRILSPLRFSLRSAGEGSNGSQILQIADRKNQPGSPWTVDFHQPISAMTHDYAIIARFQANMTDGEVMVIAGLGSGGTESASKFVSSAAYMTQLARHAPRNWRSMNMEAVVETEVIGGRAGHPHIVAAEFW
jgi:hypothetical protein